MLTVTEMSIQREYWMLTLHKGFFETVLVQGRRRTSERFWPGVELDGDAMIRLASTMRDVTSIVDTFSVNPQPQELMTYPYFDLLAVCDGQDYVIEMTSSRVGTGLRSTCTTIYGNDNWFLPFLYLVDGEVWQFSSDIDDLAAAWLGLAEARV